ncbi:MAG TPA: hypothetical protein VFO24_03775 [Usitatibacter sp.]|nr:hypothetical protein [Usitatibacter sp.]
MDAVLDSTRGFERSDPGWHCKLEIAESAEEVVALVRDYVASLAPEHLGRLPDACRSLRVKAEDDIEYWTYRLSQRPRHEDATIDGDFMQDVFNHFLHASLRISQIRRAAAAAPVRGH